MIILRIQSKQSDTLHEFEITGAQYIRNKRVFDIKSYINGTETCYLNVFEGKRYHTNIDKLDAHKIFNAFRTNNNEQIAYYSLRYCK